MYILFFIAGLIFGSFGNVLIYRVPLKKSIIRPPSHCPSCGARLRWYENIPVISWIVLGGKCGNCGKKISLRYPLVELFSGLIFLLSCFLYRDKPIVAIYVALFLFYLMVISLIDIEKYIIPNTITYPFFGIAFLSGITLSLFNIEIFPVIGEKSFLISVMGAVICFVVLLVIDFMGRLIFKQESVGAGDIKLGAIIGLFLGWYSLLSVLIAFLIGAIVGLIVIIINRRQSGDLNYVPLGPFLSVGSLITIIYGIDIVHWYLTFIL